MPKKRAAHKKSLQKQLLREEKKIEALEQQDLQGLQELNKQISKDRNPHPLTRITRADIIRSIIGALIGTVGHFSFFYYSGFRKVKEIRIFRFIPLRVMVVYIISLAVVVGTLFIFGFIDTTSSFSHLYKVVSTTLLLAVLGASTADILGKE